MTGTTRQSLTAVQRRDKFDETHQIATGIIQSQRDSRNAKTARLRALRMQMASEEAEAHTIASGKNRKIIE
jgi:hypothetical protein